MIKVRIAEQRDLKGISEIEKKSFTWEGCWTHIALKRWFHSSINYWIVAVDESDKILGFCICFLDIAAYRYRPAKAGMELNTIAVHPSLLGKGIGSILLEDVVRTAKERKMPVIELYVRSKNESAKGLYNSRGFKEVARIKKHFLYPTDDAIIMELSIDN